MIKKESMTILFLIGFGTQIASIAGAKTAAPEPQGGFVTAEGTKLKLNGGDFYFSGVNSYSTLYSETDAEKQFELLSEIGGNVLRFWGFWNGGTNVDQVDEDGNLIRTGTPDTDMYGRFVLQSSPGVYPEQAWRRMDYAIYLAHVYGIKLIIPLMNQWPEFGGIDMLLRWVGVDMSDMPPESEGHYNLENWIKTYRGLFWADDEIGRACKQIYRDYVHHMLNRVNVYTGITYKDDPAVMIWELFNEPRFGPWGEETTGKIVRDWLADAAAYVKSIDQNHLVSTGEEGFLRTGDNSLGRNGYPWYCASGEGIDFLQTAEIEDIDVFSIHSWPFQWNLWGISEQDINRDTVGEYPEPEDMAVFEKEWIEEHARIAESFNKPVYLGEFGYQILRADESTLELRNLIFKAVYDTSKEVNIAGDLVYIVDGSHNVEVAKFKVPREDWNRNTIVMGQINDELIPHDLDYKFEVFCPEDEETCSMIKDFSSYQTARIENPDPPFEPPCLSPQSLCGKECVFLDSHPDHCGKCSVICDEDETCSDGECIEIAPMSDDTTSKNTEECSTVDPGRNSSDIVSLIVELLF